jgi:hypothetical protein
LYGWVRFLIDVFSTDPKPNIRVRPSKAASDNLRSNDIRNDGRDDLHNVFLYIGGDDGENLNLPPLIWYEPYNLWWTEAERSERAPRAPTNSDTGRRYACAADAAITFAVGLSGHPKPANEGHLKTGQR